ncbi:MAG: hypothetical protein ACN2B6_03500 [Rickettsiales bacterium]
MSDTIVVVEPSIQKIEVGSNHTLEVAEKTIQVITVGLQGPQGSQGPAGVDGNDAPQSLSCPIYNPHQHEAVEGQPFIFYVDADQFANGITVTEVRLAVNGNSSYSLGILDMDNPTDATPTTITTIAVSGATEATTTPNTDVAAGQYVGLDLPDTSAGYILVQIFFERKVA